MYNNHEQIPAPAHDAYGKLVQAALSQAAQAVSHNDVPVGALITGPDGAVISAAHNHVEYSRDPSLHAEIIALRTACAVLQTTHLNHCTLVSTLEPCVMCAGAIINARIARVVFAAWDPKSGAAGSVLDILRNRLLPHAVEVIGGIREEESSAMLRKFFEGKRSGKAPPIC